MPLVLLNIHILDFLRLIAINDTFLWVTGVWSNSCFLGLLKVNAGVGLWRKCASILLSLILWGLNFYCFCSKHRLGQCMLGPCTPFHFQIRLYIKLQLHDWNIYCSQQYSYNMHRSMGLLSHLLRWCKTGTQEYVSIGRRLGKKLGAQICLSKLKKTCKSYYGLYNPFTRLSCSKYSWIYVQYLFWAI